MMTLGISASTYFAQSERSFRAVRGYLCQNDDSEEPPSRENAFGHIGLMVGKKPVVFRVVHWGIPMEATYPDRHTHPKTDRLGTEYMVQYRIVRDEKQARTIASTGKFKPVEPCLMG